MNHPLARLFAVDLHALMDESDCHAEKAQELNAKGHVIQNRDITNIKKKCGPDVSALAQQN